MKQTLHCGTKKQITIIVFKYTYPVPEMKCYGNYVFPVAPSFVEKPAPQNMIVGQSAFFSCRAEGNPKPTLSWLKDGKCWLTIA